LWKIDDVDQVFLIVGYILYPILYGTLLICSAFKLLNLETHKHMIILCLILSLSTIFVIGGIVVAGTIEKPKERYAYRSNIILFYFGDACYWIGYLLVGSFFLKKALTFKLIISPRRIDKVKLDSWNRWFRIANVILVVLVIVLQVTVYELGWDRFAPSLVYFVVFMTYTGI
jgi:hypothetical protein